MNEIRIIDGSLTDEINSLAISPDGETFVSGGGDKIVKVGNMQAIFTSPDFVSALQSSTIGVVQVL